MPRKLLVEGTGNLAVRKEEGRIRVEIGEDGAALVLTPEQASALARLLIEASEA